MLQLNKSRRESQVSKLAKQKLIFIFNCFILLCFCYKFPSVQSRLTVSTISLSLYFLITYFFNNKNKFGKQIKSTNKAVLITGCDTGFGFSIAKRLSRKGFQVFAGCLSPFKNGGLELKSVPNVHCLQMDVSREQDINFVLNYIERNLGENELWAIINNAGISKGSEVEITSMQKIEEVIDVNLLGTIRVTKAFLPLLRKSKGRIINVASAAGRLTMPGFVPYSTSKQAIIAFSDGLRLEMQKFGVSVVTIEPWMFRTRLSDPAAVSRYVEKQWIKGSDSVKTAYSGAYAAKLKNHTKGLFASVMDSNIDKVINAMEDSVTSECPPYHYRPGRWYLNVFLKVTSSLPKPLSDYILCKFVFKNH